MKCSKCGYLGFETGDRCKNCGYDFSLAIAPVMPAAEPEPALPPSPFITPDPPLASVTEQVVTPDVTLISEQTTVEEMELWLKEPPRKTPPSALPLFVPEDPDDAPLVSLPVVPRPPLAVRRTPQTPRLRAMPKTVEPELNFREPEAEESQPETQMRSTEVRNVPLAVGTDRIAGRRVAAAAIDHGILFGIDLIVAYFTLRMAGLTLSEMRLIPPVPFFVFLAMTKFAYFAAFTAVGGQTVGKMAMSIRVVDDANRQVDGQGALRRTMAAVLSHLTLGLAYLPALLGGDRRALHDRVAHTRVVALPSA